MSIQGSVNQLLGIGALIADRTYEKAKESLEPARTRYKLVRGDKEVQEQRADRLLSQDFEKNVKHVGSLGEADEALNEKGIYKEPTSILELNKAKKALSRGTSTAFFADRGLYDNHEGLANMRMKGQAQVQQRSDFKNFRESIAHQQNDTNNKGER